jgi:hypothetical protein
MSAVPRTIDTIQAIAGLVLGCKKGLQGACQKLAHTANRFVSAAEIDFGKNRNSISEREPARRAARIKAIAG